MKFVYVAILAILAHVSLAEEKLTTIVDVLDSDTFEEYVITDTSKHAFVEFWGEPSPRA